MRIAPLALVALMFGSASCAHEFEPPDRAERTLRTEAAFSQTLFDSLAWASDDVRRTEGNAVYTEECRRCHGQLARGATAYAQERGLEVPSLVEPEWALAGVDTLRHAVFVGHDPGMPGFGEGDLSPRQIDAVTAYILFTLRPEVLNEG